MKKILVTGCNGQLGRAINEVYKNDDVEIINTDVADLDITNLDEVLGFVEEKKPEVIINCAAHTNVNACETQEELAFKINAEGPKNLSIAATKVGAKIIHISTDYVFDGTNTNPYTEEDEPAPLGVYGKSKFQGEENVKANSDKYMIIRTAWLYGDGNNFVRTMLNLAKTRDEVSVVGDQIGSPTSALELARATKFLEPTENYGIINGTCEGYCSWADFTDKIYEMAGLTTKVNHITTDEYPTPAKRPAYSVLENKRLKELGYSMKEWKDALTEYFESGLANV